MTNKEVIKDGIHEYYCKNEYSHQLRWRGNYKDGLKMAEKRSKVACVLNVTAASDIFTQDIEDMPEFTDNSSKPNAEVKKTQSKSSQQPSSVDTEIITHISKVTQKKGKKKNGQEYTQYFIHSTSGTIYKTFDKKLAETASEASDTNQECLILFEYNEQFKSNEIQAIQIVPNGSEDDNANPPDDDQS